MSDKFTEEQRGKALQALVLADLSPTAASRRLKSDGIDIAPKTLRDYRAKFADEIAELQETRAWVKDKLAAEWETVSAESLTAIRKSLAVVNSALDGDDIPADKAIRIAKEAGILGGISTDKASQLRGEPSIIVERRGGLADQLALLAKKFPNVVQVNPEYIESTATEVEAPELPAKVEE